MGGCVGVEENVVPNESFSSFAERSGPSALMSYGALSVFRTRPKAKFRLLIFVKTNASAINRVTLGIHT